MKYVNQLTGLRELTLSQDPITDTGLADLKDLRELRSLLLNKTRVADRGMKVLKGFTKLESLLENIQFEAANYIPHKIEAVHLDYQVFRGSNPGSIKNG